MYVMGHRAKARWATVRLSSGECWAAQCDGGSNRAPRHFILSVMLKSADDEEGPMPSTRALNSMRALLSRAQLTPVQLNAAILLSFAIPLMLLPTCPYSPCTPPSPTMPRSANSHPHIFQPNHPARDTLHPHTTHTIPLPYQLFWMVLAFSRCPSKGLHTKSNVIALQPNAAKQKTHENHR